MRPFGQGYVVKEITHPHFGPDPVHVFALDVTHNAEVMGASRLAGEASSAEGATSTVVLGAERPRKE